MQVIEVAFNDGAAALVPQYVQQFQPNHPVGFMDRVPALTYLQISVMTPGYVPKMAFIDRAGIIRAQYTGGEPYFNEPEKSIRATLDELLKASPAVKKARGTSKKS